MAKLNMKIDLVKDGRIDRLSDEICINPEIDTHKKLMDKCETSGFSVMTHIGPHQELRMAFSKKMNKAISMMKQAGYDYVRLSTRYEIIYEKYNGET